MVNTWLLPLILSFIFLIVLIVLIIIIVRIIIKERSIDIPPNTAKIDCTTRSQFTDGYTSGLLKQLLPRKNGTYFIEFYPDDAQQGEGVPPPESKSFIVGKEYFKPFARGEKSPRREFIYIAPRNQSQLPEKMREVELGRYLSVEGQKAFLERTFGINFVSGGDEAIHEALKISGNRGLIKKATLQQMQEELKELNKLKTNPEENK